MSKQSGEYRLDGTVMVRALGIIPFRLGTVIVSRTLVTYGFPVKTGCTARVGHISHLNPDFRSLRAIDERFSLNVLRTFHAPSLGRFGVNTNLFLTRPSSVLDFWKRFTLRRNKGRVRAG